jgi:hypothetical protein
LIATTDQADVLQTPVRPSSRASSTIAIVTLLSTPGLINTDLLIVNRLYTACQPSQVQEVEPWRCKPPAISTRTQCMPTKRQSTSFTATALFFF